MATFDSRKKLKRLPPETTKRVFGDSSANIFVNQCFRFRVARPMAHSITEKAV